MSGRNPASVLYDADGNAIATTRRADVDSGASVLPIAGIGTGGWIPDPTESYVAPGSETADAPRLDGAANLRARSQVLTDEGSLRDDFAGTSLDVALTGTLSFENGSDVVTGVGTLFSEELTFDFYVSLDADGEAARVKIAQVVSDEELRLAEPYSGSTATGAASAARWFVETTSGGAIAVAGSVVSLTADTTNGSFARVEREGDYLPMIGYFRAVLSHRRADQSAELCLCDDSAAPASFSRFRFEGTQLGIVLCESSRDGEAVEVSAVRIPQGGVSSTFHDYRIDVRGDLVAFQIDGAVVAEHSVHVPDPYAVLNPHFLIENLAAQAAPTTLDVDSIFLTNFDSVDVLTGGPLRNVAVRGNGALAVESVPFLYSVTLEQIPGKMLWFGHTQTTLGAGGARTLLTEGTFNEQTVGAQRSFKSSSASDAAAGVGVRKVRLDYISSVDGTMKAEVVTLNGTTAVNTVATDILYVQAVTSIDAGSTGWAVGTISLYASTGGLGAIMLQMLPTRATTHSATFYVPSDMVLWATGLEVYTGGAGWFDIQRTVDYTAQGGGSSVIDIPSHFFVSRNSSGYARDFQSPIYVGPRQKYQLFAKPETNNETYGALSYGWLERAT